MNSETDKLESVPAAPEQSGAMDDAKEQTEAPLLPEGLLEAEALAEAEPLETMLNPEETDVEIEVNNPDGSAESGGTAEYDFEAGKDPREVTSTVVEISTEDETSAAAEPVQAVVVDPDGSFAVKAEPAFDMAAESEFHTGDDQGIQEEESEPERLTDRELNEMIEGLCLSKAEEFQMIGYEHVTGEEIWECINDRYKKKGLPPLHQVVNDILSLKPNQFMNYLTLSMYRRS
ncbi:post-transcriptional regulator [Paenibacillus sp. UNC499MF]|uniref:post-transcriptional regulator n=1 Tax=Paenibacillus sp. UNC499MF TaxID=1502751 RepID=UPI00089FC994|nr:post-transcriptional regulator [Paenibacillus sp. UNC499MF]SEF42352.1 Post-transcriptional regulator [Paenibacillus sp. UNC499MF]